MDTRSGAEVENERLAADWQGLRAGDIITAGSMIGATPVPARQRWTNRLHASVSLSVDITFT
jgi:2-keto-4-pentenoate hydratase